MPTRAAEDLATPIRIYRGDIPTDLLFAALRGGVVAVDTETSGLDWRSNRIATCQVLVPGFGIGIVEVGVTLPERFATLIADANVRKVFHHAMFDLRFMMSQWNVRPVNVVCTKIAAKLLSQGRDSDSSLKGLVHRYLGVELDKSQQLSEWVAVVLSPDQVSYAAADVYYLIELFRLLDSDLEAAGLRLLANECFAHIPTRVELEVLGYGDVYQY
jgi:ribonuclease D